MKGRANRVVIVGAGFFIAGVLMYFIGGGLFSAKIPSSTPGFWFINLVGEVCFIGFAPVGILGVVLLGVGLIQEMTTRRRPTNPT